MEDFAGHVEKYLNDPPPPSKCEMCGRVADLRPYGPKGENVCVTCGMKDEAAAKRAFRKRFGMGGLATRRN